MRLPVEIVARMREAVGKDFIIIYRLSMLDLIPDGQTWEEVVATGQGDRSAPAPPSSTPASAGTRRAFRPSPPRCRAPRSPGSRSKLQGAR